MAVQTLGSDFRRLPTRQITPSVLHATPYKGMYSPNPVRFSRCGPLVSAPHTGSTSFGKFQKLTGLLKVVRPTQSLPSSKRATVHPITFISANHSLKLSPKIEAHLTVAFVLSQCRIFSHPVERGRKDKEPQSRRASDASHPYKAPKPFSPGRQSSITQQPGPEEDSNLVPRTTVKGRGVSSPTGPFLACPLYKFNPIAHRGCLLANHLTSTSYVVQHVIRSHKKQPIHCPTCGVKFETRVDCNGHIRSERCSPQRFDHPGLTEDQWNVLQARRDRHPRLDEEARWFSLWDALFPETPRPASPFVLNEQQELLGVIRRIYRITEAWGCPMTNSFWDLLDWDFICSNIASWFSLGQTPYDLSFLSSDDRFPQNDAAANILIDPSFGTHGAGSPSDVFTFQPRSRRPSPSELHIPGGPIESEQVDNSLIDSSEMGSSQPILSSSVGSNNHDSSIESSIPPNLDPGFELTSIPFIPESSFNMDSGRFQWPDLPDWENDTGGSRSKPGT